MYGVKTVDLGQELPGKGLEGTTATVRLIDWLPAEFALLMGQRAEARALAGDAMDGAISKEQIQMGIDDMKVLLPAVVVSWNLIRNEAGDIWPIPSILKEAGRLDEIFQVPDGIPMKILETLMNVAGADMAAAVAENAEVDADSGLPLVKSEPSKILSSASGPKPSVLETEAQETISLHGWAGFEVSPEAALSSRQPPLTLLKPD